MFFDEVVNFIISLITNRETLTIFLFVIAGYIYFFFLRLKFDIKIELREVDVIFASLMFSMLTFLIALPFTLPFYANSAVNSTTMTYIINASIFFQYAFIFFLYESVANKSKRNKLLLGKILFKILNSRIVGLIASGMLIIGIIIMIYFQSIFFNSKTSFLSIVLILWPISFAFFKGTTILTEKIIKP